MRFYIKLRFTLCFERGGLRAPLKESAKLWPPLPQHCTSCSWMTLQHSTAWNVVHCCGMLCTTSWCKCSALNSGASLNRGRKFMTGISSRHESWQKIRHIPHPHHISTLSRPKNPWKEFQKYFVLYLFGADKRPWERCRETFRELCWWWLEPSTTPLSLYRSPETSLLAAKSHKQGKSCLRPTGITTHLLGRLRNKLQRKIYSGGV